MCYRCAGGVHLEIWVCFGVLTGSSLPHPTAPKPKVYSYNAVISSCQNGSQWQLALLFYEAMDGVS